MIENNVTDKFAILLEQLREKVRIDELRRLLEEFSDLNNRVDQALPLRPRLGEQSYRIEEYINLVTLREGIRSSLYAAEIEPRHKQFLNQK